MAILLFGVRIFSGSGFSSCKFKKIRIEFILSQFFETKGGYYAKKMCSTRFIL